MSNKIRTALRGLAGLLERSLHKLRRPLEQRSPEPGWATDVDQIIEDLEVLNRSTECDFLAAGEKLMGFYSTARKISKEMAGLTELISGQHGRDASDALTRMMEYTRDLGARIEQSGHELGQMSNLSGHIRLAFAGVRNTVPTFQTLCTLTRIETSRLGKTGAGFCDLAADVGPLSESIRASGEGILEASSRLGEDVDSAIRSGSGLRVKQLKELPALMDVVVKGLKAFEERRERAVESSARHAAQYDALCEAVDGVVTSVQFHDITRQQIEHVVQALRQMRTACGSGGPKCLPPDARAILRLQSSQLTGAAGVFAASMERMERDLESIALRVLEMAEGSMSLMGVSANEQDTFLRQMEGQFSAIVKMLDTCNRAQSEVESTAANLEETIGRMRNSVDDIREIEVRIQRIAMNATIRATHIGDAGNALNAIADAMHRLVLDSNTNTEAVAGTLEAMCASARRVCGGCGQTASGAGAGANGVMDELRRTVMDLHSTSESSFSRVSQIAAMGAGLAGEIGAVRSGFSASQRFDEVANRALGEMERIGAQAGPEPREGLEGVATQRLESLASHYTMQMERDVHESVARGSASVVAAPAEASKTALEDGDLGDNVELF